MTDRRKLLAAFAALAALASAPADAFFGADTIVASGKVVQESRNATGFTGVDLALPGTLVIRQGGAESVSIEADDNLLPEIETVVERGKLRLRFARRINATGRPTIRILVTGPAFDALSVSGSGDIVSESVKSASLALAVAGSGDIRIARVEAGKLSVSVAGSGDVKVAGRADEMTTKIAGAGDIEAGRLETRRSKLSIAGSGDATLWAREALEVSIAGSGSVRYHGDPEITRRVAGSGSIKRLGPAP